MNRLLRFAGLIAVGLLITALAGCTRDLPRPQSVRPPAAPLSSACPLTLDDGLSPTYVPNTPVRSVVGTGHVLTGRVLSGQDCSPIAGAKLELWPEYPGRGHPDAARATVFTDGSGAYRFECDPPEHIHMRISANGYVTIAQNSYHPGGAAVGTFEIVLAPVSR